ncbi:hypothetical protein B0H19DRAFT_1130095 [Mycena capillaripes]|nr:hypothetical protein B0H19DRAFT_1130095 [Mycena capillaripes]
MDTLPPEIISEIFSHFVKKRVAIPRREEEDGPLVLATVCRTWLQICFSTPSLWASVVIRDAVEWDWKDDVPLRFLERWLSRAKTHPLDITIYAPSSELSRVYPILSQYSTQWQRFAFLLDDDFPTDMFYGRVSALTTLELFLDEDILVKCSTFSEAPSLREVTLRSLPSEPLQVILLPWIQLTHLKLGGYRSLHDSLEILQETPNLEVLDIKVEDEPTATSLQPTLARLHTFIFSFGDNGTMLDHLILPALKTIELGGLRTAGLSRLLALGTRSAWCPRSLRLSYTDLEISNLCFRGLPSLEKVFIHYVNLAPLVKLLTTDDDFLPALYAMTIEDCLAEISSSALADMLSSRWHGKREGIARLKSFHLCFSHSAGITSRKLDEIKVRVRPFTEEGLDVAIAIRG